jgi:hypothetical protein
MSAIMNRRVMGSCNLPASMLTITYIRSRVVRPRPRTNWLLRTTRNREEEDDDGALRGWHTL